MASGEQLLEVLHVAGPLAVELVLPVTRTVVGGTGGRAKVPHRTIAEHVAEPTRENRPIGLSPQFLLAEVVTIPLIRRLNQEIRLRRSDMVRGQGPLI